MVAVHLTFVRSAFWLFRDCRAGIHMYHRAFIWTDGARLFAEKKPSAPPLFNGVRRVANLTGFVPVERSSRGFREIHSDLEFW